MALRLPLSGEISGVSFLDSARGTSGSRKGAAFNLSSRRLEVCRGKEKGAARFKAASCSLQQGPPPAWPGRAVAEPGHKSWDGPKPISIVGSTGSIGTQTLDIVAENPDKFKVVALAAGSNVTLLADQIKKFKPQLVSVRDESLIAELKEALAGVEHIPEIIPGEQGMVEVARHPDAVAVVTGIVGCAGLKVRGMASYSVTNSSFLNKFHLALISQPSLPLKPGKTSPWRTKRPSSPEVLSCYLLRTSTTSKFFLLILNILQFSRCLLPMPCSSLCVAC